MDTDKIVSLLATVTAGFISAKLLDWVWKAVTGNEPPVDGDDSNATVRQIVIFAAVSGAVAALARVYAARGAQHYLAKHGSSGTVSH